ncbi:hypothetical protein [Myxosarcina sp. GI1]|uniref:hypothetical protein n=1 Tax=Myxosarcina sp. GI1 TaxID=1541065 RepID=UPI00055E1999|nr:hypothetical protein [Myxosarcina sp. GI1]
MNNTVTNKIVLIVDRQDSDYYRLSQKLKAVGFKVVIIDESINTLNAAISLQPEIVLIDLDCNECDRVEYDERTKNISLILIASLSRSVDRLKQADWQSVDSITKPVTLKEMLMRVTIRIALRRMEARLRQEIFRRSQSEAILEQSQWLLKQKLARENGKLLALKQKLADRQPPITERELARFANRVAGDLQTLLDSLATLKPLHTNEETVIIAEEERYLELLSDCDLRLKVFIRELLINTNLEAT